MIVFLFVWNVGKMGVFRWMLVCRRLFWLFLLWLRSLRLHLFLAEWVFQVFVIADIMKGCFSV